MFRPLFSLRAPALLTIVGLLTACANGANLGDERAELGDFRLCYNIVTINDAVQGPLSREADLDVFAENIRSEIDRRFGRYSGDRLYHIAIHLDAYVLAVPGIPLVASPRSALIISVNLWDDQLGAPLHDEPEQFSVLENLSGGSIVGSGLTSSAEEQMQTLSQNAAIRIENWMAEHPEWFEVPAATDTGTADSASSEAEDPVEDSEGATLAAETADSADATDTAEAEVAAATNATNTAETTDTADYCAYDPANAQVLQDG